MTMTANLPVEYLIKFAQCEIASQIHKIKVVWSPQPMTLISALMMDLLKENVPLKLVGFAKKRAVLR